MGSKISFIKKQGVNFYTQRIYGYYSAKKIAAHRRESLSNGESPWSRLNRGYDEKYASDVIGIKKLLGYANAEGQIEKMHAVLVKLIR